MHEEEKPEDIVFNVRVLSYCKISLERQILESVIIQKERDHHLLNSKAEYNRSAVPRLTTKIGEKQYKRWEKESEKDIEKNEELEEKIINLRKMINKGRRNPIQRDGPAGKRRKMSEGKYKEMSQTSKHPMNKREEKRRWKDEAAETEKDQEAE